MPKQVRFTQLVKASGRPHPATLWVADPSKDPEFKKAIADNRILTVHHVNVGSKKESGEVGFIKGGAASYLIFPKALPFAEGSRVIGLKFDMLQEVSVKDPVKIKPAKRQPKIERANIVEFPRPETPPKHEPPPAPDPKSPKHPTKHQGKHRPEPKTKTAAGPAFQVVVEFTARATEQIEVEAKSATDAIEAALKKARQLQPAAKWQLEATDVKRLHDHK